MMHIDSNGKVLNMTNWIYCKDSNPPYGIKVVISFESFKGFLGYCVGFFSESENGYYMIAYTGTDEKRKQNSIEKILKPIQWAMLPI
jgi:hypothetical protein